ncbi:MAG: hypothetical protein F7O42_02995 [Opitutae bacterium]|nr:hypothetical protein [Opitutae bacterium]
MNRRRFFKLALALPAGAWYARFASLAAAERKQVKITDIRAMNLGNRGTSLLKILTDSGLEGYGEASSPSSSAKIPWQLSSCSTA